jgi:hypothetical protein
LWLGLIDADALRAAAVSAADELARRGQGCEADFYLGVHAADNGAKQDARSQDAGGTERAELRALTPALSWAERLRIGTWGHPACDDFGLQINFASARSHRYALSRTATNHVHALANHGNVSSLRFTNLNSLSTKNRPAA